MGVSYAIRRLQPWFSRVGGGSVTIRTALVGLGKIARDQHLPSLAKSADFDLVATVDPAAQPLESVPHFADITQMLAQLPDIEAVVIATPPQVRAKVAAQALDNGLAVMLEKPPANSVSEANALASMARQAGVSLFAAWHSREAGGVEPARQWLADRRIGDVTITWREDVRQWHPGQHWIWQAGGLGVFDPGINALSILTRILPVTPMLRAASLEVPANCQAPIAARLRMEADGAGTITADFDFRQTGSQTWEILVDTDAGRLSLAEGGSALTLPGKEPQHHPDREYERLYARFAELVRHGASDVDLAPFTLVADAFLLGEQRSIEPFVE